MRVPLGKGVGTGWRSWSDVRGQGSPPGSGSAGLAPGECSPAGQAPLPADLAASSHQIIQIQASGGVFMNSVHTRLPVSAGTRSGTAGPHCSQVVCSQGWFSVARGSSGISHGWFLICTWDVNAPPLGYRGDRGRTHLGRSLSGITSGHCQYHLQRSSAHPWVLERWRGPTRCLDPPSPSLGDPPCFLAVPGARGLRLARPGPHADSDSAPPPGSQHHHLQAYVLLHPGAHGPRAAAAGSAGAPHAGVPHAGPLLSRTDVR